MAEIYEQRMLVTPEIAREWLLKNIANNRTVSETHLDTLVRMIKNGKWVFNGNPIRFDRDGRLIDGQHRLLAVIRANMPIDTLVVWNLAPEVLDYIDDPTTWKVRSVAHIAQIHGHRNAKVKIAALRMFWAWARGQVLQSNHHVLTAQEMEEYLERNPGLCMIVDKYATTANARIVPASASMSLRYICSTIDEPAADGFFGRLFDGASLSPGSPILAIRNKVIQARGQRRPMSAPDVFVGLIKAWNYHMTGRKIVKFYLAAKDGVVRVPKIFGIELSPFYEQVRERYGCHGNGADAQEEDE